MTAFLGSGYGTASRARHFRRAYTPARAYGSRKELLIRKTSMAEDAPRSPKKFDKDLFIGGGLPEGAIAEAGVKSVLYLRREDEAGAAVGKKRKECEDKGIEFCHVPLDPKAADRDVTEKIVSFLESAPKPVMVECGQTIRASAAASVFDGRRRNLTAQDVKKVAEERGLPWTMFPGVAKWVFSSVQS